MALQQTTAQQIARKRTASRPSSTMTPRPTYNPGASQPAALGGAGAAPTTIGSTLGVGNEDLFQPVRVNTPAPGEVSGPARRRDLLGNLGFTIDPRTNARDDLPYIQASLNFDTLLMAEQDRQQAYNLLNNQILGVGQTPEQQYARQVALWRLQNPDPISQQDQSLLASRARQGAASGLQSAQREYTDSLASRGLTGGPSAFQSAALQQAAEAQAQDELQRLAIENAMGRRAEEGKALDALQGMGAQDELRRMALAEQISQLLQTNRGSFDLSGMAAKTDTGGSNGIMSKIFGGLF